VIGDIVGEVVGTVARWVLIDIVTDLLIKVPGYFIVRAVRDSDAINPDGWRVVVAGILFWLVMGGAGYGLYLLIK